MYTTGCLVNIIRYSEMLPDYKCVVFCDSESVPDKIVYALNSGRYGVQLHMMAHQEDCLGLYWRFYGFISGMYERFIVRDSDSRPSKREIKAIREWENSECGFHIIRDHIQHGIPILGGTMGAVAGVVPGFSSMLDVWLKNLLPDYKNPRGLYHNSDQLFFDKFVWPVVMLNNMAHDRYFNFSGHYGSDLGCDNGDFIGKTFGVSDEERMLVKEAFGI